MNYWSTWFINNYSKIFYPFAGGPNSANEVTSEVSSGVDRWNQSRSDWNQDQLLDAKRSRKCANGRKRRRRRMSPAPDQWGPPNPAGRRAPTRKRKWKVRPSPFLAKGSFSFSRTLCDLKIFPLFIDIYHPHLLSSVLFQSRFVRIYSFGRNPIRTRKPFRDRPTSLYSRNSLDENRLSLVSVNEDDGDMPEVWFCFFLFFK
jgi:hypothetical protein